MSEIVITSLPIRRIKRKDGTFAITTMKGKYSQRLGVYVNATDAIREFKALLATGNYHEPE